MVRSGQKFELVWDFLHVLVTCKYKKDRTKSNREKVEISFSPIIIGAFCSHGHQSFDPICLKTICSLSPPPVMLHIKFDQDWPTGLRDIQVWKRKIFVIQGQVTPKWVVWSGPNSNSSKLLCLSCPGYQQLWWWFDQKWTATMETPFCHYKYMGNLLDTQGQLIP